MSDRRTVTRRALLISAPAAVASIPALSAPVAADPETDGLSALPLAAVHINRAIAAMGEIRPGWTVTIQSGDAEQEWSFRRKGARLTVAGAIEAHRAAKLALEATVERAWAAEEALAANPKYELRPKVQYSRMVSSGEDVPLYAYSHEDLDRRCEEVCRVDWHPTRIEARRQHYADLHKELERNLRRKKRLERKAGLTQASNEMGKAYLVEEHTAVALMLATPRNAEAEAKRKHMRNYQSFTPAWWDGSALFNALMANVEGGAA